MRRLLLALVLFALGLGTAFLLVSPRAGARVLDTTITGSVGTSGDPNAFSISLGASSLAPGSYTFDITDYATIHNFDLIDPSGTSVDATSISGTGEVMWSVTLTPGTWTYRCDMHHSLNGSFTVTGGTTSTTTSTSTSTSTSTTTSTTPTTTVTTTVPTTTKQTTTGQTTTQQTTTTSTTTGGGGGPLKVRILAVHATPKLVVVTVKPNQLARAVATLSHKGKRLARVAGDNRPGKLKLQLKLRPKHGLKPGSYVVQVKVSCCGTSAKSKKTITVS